eukprot:XP_015575899.1 uncharacterized protein LOC107261408 [Ricinus communis]
MVQLSKKSSVIIQRRLPKKLEDLRNFTIPCFIGSLNIDNALANLGASISVMRYNLFKKLGLGEPKPTFMSIQMVEKSVIYPSGIIEDLLVKVREFIFLMEFIVIEMDETVDVFLILERPFLVIVRAIIDVHNGNLIIRVGEEQVTFQIPNAVKHPLVLDDMDLSNDRIKYETVNFTSSIIAKDPLELCLVQE